MSARVKEMSKQALMRVIEMRRGKSEDDKRPEERK